MAQNKTHAVMAQRAEPDDSLDDFPTPPWAVRALMEKVMPARALGHGTDAVEPAANRGFMLRTLREYYPGGVSGFDVHDYGVGLPHLDFLYPATKIMAPGCSRVITNPPFRLAGQFIAKSMTWATVGCCMLLRTQFTEGMQRYKTLYRDTPPTLIAYFTERVIMHKGILRDPAVKYWNPQAKDKKTKKRTGAMVKPSTATAYAWFIWDHGREPQPPMWIPPCRAQLERPGDYSL